MVEPDLKGKFRVNKYLSNHQRDNVCFYSLFLL